MRTIDKGRINPRHSPSKIVHFAYDYFVSEFNTTFVE